MTKRTHEIYLSIIAGVFILAAALCWKDISSFFMVLFIGLPSMATNSLSPNISGNDLDKAGIFYIYFVVYALIIIGMLFLTKFIANKISTKRN